MKKTITIDKHVLLPKVTKLSDKEKEELFSKYSITIKELPKILRTDPTIQNIDPKAGDIIKVIRNNELDESGINAIIGLLRAGLREEFKDNFISAIKNGKIKEAR